MEKRVKTNPLQWSMFLDFAEKHPEILTKKFSSMGSKQKYNDLWKEVSSHLNSMGFQQKSVEKWQKVSYYSYLHYYDSSVNTRCC